MTPATAAMLRDGERRLHERVPDSETDRVWSDIYRTSHRCAVLAAENAMLEDRIATLETVVRDQQKLLDEKGETR